MHDRVVREFIIELGVALHRAGTPAHRLERALVGVAARLGVEAQFFTTPTQLIVGFGPVGDQRAAMVRVEPGEVNLEKLAALDRLADAVTAGEVTLDAGLSHIRRIVDEPARPGAPVLIAAYGLTSAAVARFFDGGWPELATAALIGVAIGTLALASARTVAGARVFELCASFVAATIAAAAAHTGLGVSAHIATLAGLIVLIPGFTLTVAMHELATRNLVSGTARLTAAAMSFLQIGFGVALGAQVAARVLGDTPLARGAALPGFTEPIALIVAAVAIGALFRAHPRETPGIVVACVSAFYGARLGAELVGPALGASIGAFVVGAGSNAWARWADRPAMVPLVPALILLVPGSLGFRSFTSMLERDVITGIDTAFTMVLVAVSLVAGLLVANAAVPPRRNL